MDLTSIFRGKQLYMLTSHKHTYTNKQYDLRWEISILPRKNKFMNIIRSLSTHWLTICTSLLVTSFFLVKKKKIHYTTAIEEPRKPEVLLKHFKNLIWMFSQQEMRKCVFRWPENKILYSVEVEFYTLKKYKWDLKCFSDF